MALRRAYLEVYGQTIPLQTLRGRNQGQAPDHQILALLVHRATDSHVGHRLIDSLQIFLTRHYSRMSTDQLLHSGQHGLFTFATTNSICYIGASEVTCTVPLAVWSTAPTEVGLGSLHNSGCL